MKELIELLGTYSLSGIWRLLEREKIVYKRGLLRLHSPDVDYESKRDAAIEALHEARQNHPRVVTLYLDEMSYYRQPTVANAWHERGASTQPQAKLSTTNNTRRRVVGALDAVSGAVVYQQKSKITVAVLASMYRQIRQAYPHAETIYLIQDNWPVHRHAIVLQAATDAAVTPVMLPTYAPWLNPIEKLWRKLRQEVLHLHRHSDAWANLIARVEQFLDGFKGGSEQLCRYVGLGP